MLSSLSLCRRNGVVVGVGKDRPPMVRIATAAEDSATETSILSMY